MISRSGPGLEENGLPASAQLRQILSQRRRLRRRSQTEMLGLNTLHHGHVVDSMHSAVVLVKSSITEPKRARAGNIQEAQADSERRERVESQECRESAGSRQTSYAASFEIVCEAIPPTLGPKGQSSVSLRPGGRGRKPESRLAMRSGSRASVAQRTSPRRKRPARITRNQPDDDEFTLFLILARGLLHLALCVTVHGGNISMPSCPAWADLRREPGVRPVRRSARALPPKGPQPPQPAGYLSVSHCDSL